jgi:rubrerythrin
MAASYLVSEAEVTEKSVYNVSGGILAWDGHQIQGFPRIDVLNPEMPIDVQMMTAMNLEKGAYRFYLNMLDRFAETPIAGTIKLLSKAETAHARSVYDIWSQTQTDPEPFETLFERLDGDILEGGDTLKDMLARFDSLEGDSCINFVEIAIAVEYAAFDLYRTLAEKAADPSARAAFETIAQAEKGHMQILSKALEACIG